MKEILSLTLLKIIFRLLPVIPHVIKINISERLPS
jgi:hypothetical protein